MYNPESELIISKKRSDSPLSERQNNTALVSGKLKIISEVASDDQKKEHWIEVENRFFKPKSKSVVEAEKLGYTFPVIQDIKANPNDFKPTDIVTVRYVDRENRLLETEWTFKEYLERIGVDSDEFRGKDVGEYFRYLAESGEDTMNNAFRKIQEKSIKDRMYRAFLFDQKLKNKKYEDYSGWNAEQIFSERDRQLTSMYNEDPFFEAMFKSAGFLEPVSISRHIDYIDKIDVLLELDLNEIFPNKKNESETKEVSTTPEAPIYIGVQRTLLERSNDRLIRKEDEIKAKPLIYMPEHPEKGKVLRILYREDPGDYYLSDNDKGKDATTRYELLDKLTTDRNNSLPKKESNNNENERLIPAYHVMVGNTKSEIEKKRKDPQSLKMAEERMVVKNLDVLYQALACINGYLDDGSKEKDKKTFLHYKKALEGMIGNILNESGLKEEKIKRLLGI